MNDTVMAVANVITSGIATIGSLLMVRAKKA